MEFPDIGARKASAEANKATTPTNTARTMMVFGFMGSIQDWNDDAISPPKPSSSNETRKGKEKGRDVGEKYLETVSKRFKYDL